MEAYLGIILHNYEFVTGISRLIANLSPLGLLKMNTPLSSHKKRSKKPPEGGFGGSKWLGAEATGRGYLIFALERPCK